MKNAKMIVWLISLLILPILLGGCSDNKVQSEQKKTQEFNENFFKKDPALHTAEKAAGMPDFK